MDKLSEIFKIISFFDDFRWKSGKNSFINYFKCKDDLDNDTKLLTHWLCYITDRQMPFEIIWDVGGFVFSEMIYEIKLKKDIELLNPEKEDSFVHFDSTKGKYYFRSKINANQIISNGYVNNTDINKKVIFKSRFLPSDYFCILNTFAVLEDFDYKLTKFIAFIIKKNQDKDNLIQRILFSLYLLTYDGTGQPNSESMLNYNDNLGKALARKNYVLDIINDSEKFEKQLTDFTKSKIFHQKRAGCSLRDFVKSTEFSPYFREALIENGLEEDKITKLFEIESLEQFELPGDVWNNNSKFKNCILKDTVYHDSNKPLNYILREHFEKCSLVDLIGYPEQFDVTFDFVPRMCDKNNCDICPINHIDENVQEDHFDKVCIKNESFYCPVALVSCNYQILCVGVKNCKLLH